MRLNFATGNAKIAKMAYCLRYIQPIDMSPLAASNNTTIDILEFSLIFIEILQVNSAHNKEALRQGIHGCYQHLEHN
jgi:hypothetical protein